MYCNQIDSQFVAQAELNAYLEFQAALIAPEIPALVPAPITVERVGFTRNASNVPYIVYRVRGGSRCSRFIKRRHFIEIVQAFLAQVSGVEEWIISITSTKDWGFAVKRGRVAFQNPLEGVPAQGLVKEFIPHTVINSCIEQFNNARLPFLPKVGIRNWNGIKVGDMVYYDYPPVLCHLSYWEPFEVLSIKDGFAQLELIEKPVPLSKLSLEEFG